MCCSLSLCETFQTYVLRVQIWVWNLLLPLVLLLCPCIWGSQLNRLRTGHPSRRVASVLVEIQTVPIVVETIERIQKVHRSLYRTNFTLWAYLERCNTCLGTDADSWLKSLNFGGSYYFWRWMAWTWDKEKEGTQNSPPPYWEPSSYHDRARLGLWHG